MLEIAFRNERQHRQLCHGDGPLRLALTDRATSFWQTIDQAHASSAEAVIEIAPADEGVALTTIGCEIAAPSAHTRGERSRVLPLRVIVGDTWLEIVDSTQRTPMSGRSLERLHDDDRRKRDADGALASTTGLAPETLARWFSILGSLNGWSSCVQELFEHAARAAVESIGLDGAIVLRYRDDQWDIAASHLPRPELGILCDRSILNRLVETPETVFHAFSEPVDHSSTDSPSSLPALVVSPLCGIGGELTGAIYGYRSVREGNQRRAIRRLEAHLIELLAGAISDGMVRLEQEAASERRAVLVEHALRTGGTIPTRLLSEQREVTLLFADLRDFSSLSELLTTEQVFELLSQVMDSLTSTVMHYDGQVIDYYGDGLAAMWNAPSDQSDHAELACRAALQMPEYLAPISRAWSRWLKTELRLGIGIHTGTVQVGNAGSAQRLKYGPRGTNVHIAHRIEGATKIIGVPLVISETVAARLSNRTGLYRLCRGELTGIHRPFDLYSILPAIDDANPRHDMLRYEAALALFEQGCFEQALFELGRIEAGTELPTDFLYEQIEQEAGRQHRRRQTDKQGSMSSHVVRLRVK